MNLLHRWHCRSAGWCRQLHDSLLPATFGDLPLDGRILELGPGPGAATTWFAARASRLSVVDTDLQAVERIRRRVPGTDARVGDAADLPFPDATFGLVASCTMLHHLPGSDRQDLVLREAVRVLEPGGWFCGFDVADSVKMRLVHVADTFTPVDPRSLPGRLTTAGMTDVHVTRRSHLIRFRGRRPG